MLLHLFVLFFSAKPQLPVDYSKQTWAKLEEAVFSIQNSKSVCTSLEELYQAVQNLCSHKMAYITYNKLRVLIKNHITKMILNFLDNPNNNLPFLKSFDKCWEAHCNQMVGLLHEFREFNLFLFKYRL